MNRYLLVLTACIDPSAGEYLLHRNQPSVRLADYKSALEYWLSYPDERIRKILFIENSKYPLHELQEVARTKNPLNKEVEFISLDCNWYPPGGHYGYAELRMLDLGLEQSRLRSETTHMIKVSGRFRFPKLNKLLNLLPQSFDAAADARIWQSPTKRLEHPNVTTQIILFEHDFYQKYLFGCYKELETAEDTHMEYIYYVKLMALKDSHKILFRFPINMTPVGQPAHRSKSYQHPTQVAKNAVRAAARRLFPNWWL
jgi:hypothetical protein